MKTKGGINIKIQFVFTVTLTMKLETDNQFLKAMYFSYGKAVYYCIILESTDLENRKTSLIHLYQSGDVP